MKKIIIDIRFKRLQAFPVFQNVFLPHENENPAFSNSPGQKSVSEKLRFRDGLVCSRPAVEIKLRFEISPA